MLIPNKINFIQQPLFALKNWITKYWVKHTLPYIIHINYTQDNKDLCGSVNDAYLHKKK